MEELTECIAGSTVFIKIKMLWSYTQLELTPELRYLTAVVTHVTTQVGVFQWKSVAFGLFTGPSAFRAVIAKIIAGLDGCTNILNDMFSGEFRWGPGGPGPGSPLADANKNVWSLEGRKVRVLVLMT